MANVSAEDVRDVLNVSASDIPDAKILKMISRAAVTLGLELELSDGLDYSDCTDGQKEAITLLAALYVICYLTGGSAIGLNFSVGDLSTSTKSDLPALEVLQVQLEKVLENLKEPYVGSA